MPEFDDSKKLEIKNRIASWDRTETKTAATLQDLHLTREEVERLMWDTRGRWVFSGDNEYEERRKLFYNNFKYILPLAIAVCHTEYDVQCFLKCIYRLHQRGFKVPFAPRSGGHSTAGYSTVQSGIMLDLRELNDQMFDPKQNVISVGPGVQFRDFYRVLDSHGRFTPGAIFPDLCVGGYMQGGGYGFGSRMFGMNCDNVINLTVVLANGRLVQANEKVNADLLWAIRGGTGNNFGIVTQVAYKTYEAPQFGAIAMRWKIDTNDKAQQGAEVMDLMQRKFMGSNRDRTFGYMVLFHFLEEDDEKVPYLLMRTVYIGKYGTGSDLLKDLIAIDGCEVEWEANSSYPELNSRLMGYDKYDNKTQFTNTNIEDIPSQEKQSRFFKKKLGIDGWKAVIDHFRSAKSEFNCLPKLHTEPGGAAIDDTKRGGNAYIHRNDDFNAFLNVYWKDNSEKEKALCFLNKWLEIVGDSPYQEAYQNYPKPYVDNWSQRYWAEYYPCLCAVKQKYDPHNLFRFQQSVGSDGGPCPKDSMERAKGLLPDLAEHFDKPIEYLCP
ncbi:MAG: FAD-binding oxidoreductase [Okeania sp. SIO2D1]|nr:FAD-binding oxidoreductase [Okeania sp. SIO2D1]